MSSNEEARELHPWSRGFRNSDNETGRDFRPQFVEPEMPYAEDLPSSPDGYPSSDEEEVEASESGSGDGQDPKDSTATGSATSSEKTESSPKGASRSSEESTAGAATVVPGVVVPGV